MSPRNLLIAVTVGLLGLTGCPATSVPAESPAPKLQASLPREPGPVRQVSATVEFTPAEVRMPPVPLTESTCVPGTCEFFVASCGEVSDGCGGLLNCGTCATGQTCGGDGLPNVCSARASMPAVQWLETFPGGVFGLTAGKGSALFLIRQTLRNNVLTLLGADGVERWTRHELAPQVNFSGLSVAASGDLLAWGRRDGSMNAGTSVYRLDTSGTVLDTDSPDTLPESLLQDSAGNQLDYDHTYTSAVVRYRTRQGQGWMLQSTPRWAYPPTEAWDPFHFQAVALDPRGGAFIAGSIRGQGTLLGQTVGRPEQPSPFVLKVTPEGKLVRAWELPNTDAALRLIGTSMSGALVGQGHYVGTLRWPGGVLSSGDLEESRPFLMSLDAQGRLSWVRPLPWHLDTGLLAVSSAGRIAVANGFSQSFGRETYASAVHVRVYDAQGNLEWSRSFFPTESSGSVFLGGLDWSGEQLVLAGSFHGAVDFGTGVQQGPSNPSASSEGFVLKFR